VSHDVVVIGHRVLAYVPRIRVPCGCRMYAPERRFASFLSSARWRAVSGRSRAGRGRRAVSGRGHRRTAYLPDSGCPFTFKGDHGGRADRDPHQGARVPTPREECLAMARSVSTEKARDSLRQMAQVWHRLADEQDQGSELGSLPPFTAEQTQPVVQQQQQVQPDDDKKE
jgi:hypothetical protein